MIITVTLNPALDRTLEVPELHAGAQASEPRSAHDPGRQGRQRRARAEAAGPAGDRHRHHRRRYRHADHRSAGRRVDPQRVCPHPRGVAHQHGGARPDDRASTPRSTSADPRSPSTSSSCSSRSSCTWPAGRASACSPAACRAGSSPDTYAKLIRSVRKLGVLTVVDTDGEPLKLAVRAEADVVSPNELEAEELAGHEFGGIDDRARAVVEITPSGAGRGDHDGARRLLRVRPRGGGQTLYRVTIEPLEAQSPIGSGDAFLAGYVAARYRAVADRVPAVRRRLRRRVDAARRRRDPRSGRPSSGSSRASSRSRSRSPRTSPERPAARALTGAANPIRPLLRWIDSRWLPPSRPCVSREKWGSPCHPFDLLRCADGSRNWPWKEGPPGLWI